MKKIILAVALLFSVGAAQANTTVQQLNAGIPSCLQLYTDSGPVFYACGKYVMKVDMHFADPAYRYITCNKDDDGKLRTCHYVDN